jgi:hypothetical protein
MTWRLHILVLVCIDMMPASAIGQPRRVGDAEKAAVETVCRRIKATNEALNPVWVRYIDVEVAEQPEPKTTKTFREFAKKGAKYMSWTSVDGFRDGRCTGDMTVFDGKKCLETSNHANVYLLSGGPESSHNDFPLLALSGELGLVRGIERDMPNLLAGKGAIVVEDSKSPTGRLQRKMSVTTSTRTRAVKWWDTEWERIVFSEQFRPDGTLSNRTEVTVKDCDGVTYPHEVHIKLFLRDGSLAASHRLEVVSMARSAPDSLFTVELSPKDMVFDRERHTLIRNTEDAEANLRELTPALIPRGALRPWRLWVNLSMLAVSLVLLVRLWSSLPRKQARTRR